MTKEKRPYETPAFVTTVDATAMAPHSEDSRCRCSDGFAALRDITETCDSDVIESTLDACEWALATI